MICLFRTIIGIKCVDGVVMGVEKFITSRMLRKDANRLISTVSSHAGMSDASPHSTYHPTTAPPAIYIYIRVLSALESKKNYIIYWYI